jgi:manganese/iron transport system ATP-binding protein
MLEIQQLAVNYRGVSALEQTDFRIGLGELVGLTGPNGAGKSTPIEAMLGLIPTASGTIRYCTCPLCQQLERVVYVPQRSQVDWDYPITVWNVVMMARTPQLGWLRRPGAAAKAIVNGAIDRVGMLDLRHRLSQLDRILLLNQSLIADGSPEQVMTPANLQQAHGVSFHQHSV